jgi:hypothetical protein
MRAVALAESGCELGRPVEVFRGEGRECSAAHDVHAPGCSS